MSDDKRDVTLLDRNFKQAEVVRNRWSVILSPSHRKEDLSVPKFWSIHASKLNNGDIIEVRTEDETAYGEFIVIECSRIHAKVQELSWHELGAKEQASGDPEYMYKWRGPIHRHCVVRISDQHPMVSEMPSKDACLQWIKNQKAQAA